MNTLLTTKKELTRAEQLGVMKRAYNVIYKGFIKKDSIFISEMNEAYFDSLPKLFKNTKKFIINDGRTTVAELLPFIEKLENKMLKLGIL